MNQVITYGVIAAIIIFQPEVRRGLEHLGRSAFFKTSKKEELDDERMILAFDKAIQYMSKRKIGALVTIQRSTGLDEYIETGIDLDADITGELLINILFLIHLCTMALLSSKMEKSQLPLLIYLFRIVC